MTRPLLALLLLWCGAAVAQTPDVCAPGYSRAHQMPEAESRAIKQQMLWERCTLGGASPTGGCRMADYELDHIVPLCLGGANDRSNLQLQPWPEARRKDSDEWRLCRAVCAGWMPLAEAQRQMREWRP